MYEYLQVVAHAATQEPLYSTVSRIEPMNVVISGLLTTIVAYI